MLNEMYLSKVEVCADDVVTAQEDKEAMFDTYDTMTGVLQVATGVLSTLKVRQSVERWYRDYNGTPLR